MFFLKKEIKKQLIKVVSLNEAFPSLSKANFVPSERIETPEAPQMLFPDEIRHWQGKSYSSPVAYTVILKNVLYSPEYNIIMTKDHRIIADSFIPYKPPEDFKITYLFGRKIQKISNYCTIFDQLADNHFHRVIDNIPRFYLTREYINEHFSNENIKLIHTTNIADNFFIPKLISKNMNLVKVETGKLYNLEKLIFSTFLTRHFNGCFSTSYRNKIYSQFMPKRPRQATNRIFISREKAPLGRHIINENELLQLLDKFGFKKYLLEDMPMEDQINLFYDAEAVVAPHGAGLTNLIFSEKIKVLELFQRPLIIPTYYYLSRSMGHDYRYWHSSNTKNNHFSSFEADLSQIKVLLEELLF